MGDGFQALDIILFAMIAAFLVLRLRSVLGKRTGHQKRRPNMVSDTKPEPNHNDNVAELPSETQESVAIESENVDPDDPVASGLAAVRGVDSSFDANNFISGARAAFEIVVKAFADGEKGKLRDLLNNEVYDNFSDAIDHREKKGEVLETAVIGIKSADILEARVEGRTAFVTVKVVSEQVNATKNKDGLTVDGDENQVLDVIDIWMFAKNTRARDPNWTLVETKSPQ